MKNNLDKLYQRKLGPEANREFAFQDSYWEEMEGLIEQETGNKKPVLWMWLLGLAALLVASGTFIFADKLFPEKELIQQEISTNEISANPVDDQNIAVDENLSLNNDKDFNTQSTENSNITNSNAENQPIDANKDLNSNLNQPSNKNIHSEVVPNSEVTPSIFNNPNNNTESINKSINSESTNNKESFSKSDGSPDIAETSISSDKSNDEIIENEVLKNEDLHFKKTSTEENKIQLFQTQFPNKTIDQSPLNQIFIYADDPSDKHLNVKPHFNEKPKRFSMALAAGYQLGISSVGIENEIKGWRGGVEIGYQIAPKLSVNSGLFYRGFQSNFESSDTILQINYGFDKTEDEFFLAPKSLHYLEIPLNISYHLRRSQIRFGLNTSYLIAARGRLNINEELLPSERSETENASFQNEIMARQLAGENIDDLKFRKTEMTETDWISTNGIDKFQFNMSAEYRLLVFRNLHFGVGIELPINKINVAEKSGLRLNFMASYRF